ncbi:acyltransferase [Prolixibacteraceae bacterium JC049]|nr:acyltransferase [Prolixibacteraceae bacterium JC049]
MLRFNIDFEKRIFGFDLLRAFAIFCVIHRHGRHLLNGTILQGFPWLPLPHGVDIFFVLSGFLIGYSFIVNGDKNEGKITLSKSMNFWKRSAFRILPNYFLILTINYILTSMEMLNGSIDKFSFLKFFTFTQNLFYPFYGFFWESWSLATQEWFYLLFPIVLMTLGEKFKMKNVIPIVCILFIVVSVFYRLGISGLIYDDFWWDVRIKKVALSRFDCIYWGVLAAWVRFFLKEYWMKYAKILFIVGVLLFVIIAKLPKEIHTVYYNVFYLSLVPIYIALWFPLIDQLKDIKTIIGKLITYFSILSYSMYLFNLLIIRLLDKHYSTAMSNNATLKYVVYWLITICLSYLLYMLFENPISVSGNKILKTTNMMYKRIDSAENND